MRPPSEIKSNFKFKTLKRHLLKRHLILSEEIVATGTHGCRRVRVQSTECWQQRICWVRKVAERKFPEFFELLSRISSRILLRIFPEFSRSFRASFPWKRRPKNHQNPRPFSMQNSQANTKKYSQNVSGECHFCERSAFGPAHTQVALDSYIVPWLGSVL